MSPSPGPLGGARLSVAAALVLVLGAGCEWIINTDGLDDGKCSAGEKACPNENRCVRINSAETGCGEPLSCVPCVLLHARAECQVNTEGIWACARAICNDGYADCDGDGLGCEIDTVHDPAHCGGCKTSCPTPAHGFPGCSGRCVIQGCKPGFADCNHLLDDGCEADLGSDPLNCGRCDNPCPACQQGLCPT